MSNKGINVLLIDSDSSSIKQMYELFEANPLISNIECVADSDLALIKIINSSPDVVFMEYPIPGNSGNELVKFIKAKLTETSIVFVSDSKTHAAAAIRSGVFNYLLKPIDSHEFENLIDKVLLVNKANKIERINHIIDNIPEVTRLKLQTTKGYLLINPDELIYCKAEGVYTELYLTNNRVDLTYLFLSKVEEILKPFNFMKVSRSYIINMKYVRRVYRDNNCITLLANGKEYEVKGSKQSVRILGKIEIE